MLENIKNPQYWNKLWQENLGKHLDNNPVKGWNKKAQSFSQFAATAEGHKRVNGVLNFLKKHNAFRPGIKILDMGCGPGNFSIPFALEGAEVTAFDPAPGMLEILQNRINEQKLKNIEVVQGLWEEVNVKEKGWEKKFDLVFASQSPGLRDIDTLAKMNECSKYYCFASGFDGNRKMTLFDEFWRELYAEPYMRNSHDIIYLINLLYSLGFRPALEFLDLSRREEMSYTEAFISLQTILAQSNKDDAARDMLIKNFLDKQVSSEKQNLQQYVRHVIGLLLWKTERQN
ncbi:MAG: class I SAM-dependent methyltransferase [Peptococcaceae bacterium]